MAYYSVFFAPNNKREGNKSSYHRLIVLLFTFIAEKSWDYRQKATQLLHGEVSVWITLLYLFIYLLGPHLWHMEVPRLGIESELQLQAYSIATATATWDPSRMCNLHHSWQQCRYLTYWARPGIEPASSSLLVRFVSTVPQQEFPPSTFLITDFWAKRKSPQDWFWTHRKLWGLGVVCHPVGKILQILRCWWDFSNSRGHYHIPPMPSREHDFIW